MNWLKQKWAKFKAWAISILIAIGLVTAPILFAEDVSMSWTNATTYTDGSPMPIEEIAETRLYRQVFTLGTDIASAPRAYDSHVVIDPTQTVFTDTGLGDGIYCYVGTHVSVQGIESFYSEELCITVDARKPEPPQGLVLQ